jgi:hypothetical protein
MNVMEILNRRVSWATCLSISHVTYNMVILKFKSHMLSENLHVTPLPLRTDILSCFELVYFDDIIRVMSYTICFRRKSFIHTEHYYFNYVKGKSLYLSKHHVNMYGKGEV